MTDEWMRHPETGLTPPLPATLPASEAQGEGSDEREAREARYREENGSVAS